MLKLAVVVWIALWPGRDEVGKGVAAGVYIYKVEVDGQLEAKKTTKLP